MTHPTPVPVTELPDTIRSYLTAHAARDVDEALAPFDPAAEVVDDCRTYRGPAAIRTFLRTAGTRFNYTTELLGAERIDDAAWIAHHRLEGDFPGGVVELAYRFELSSGLITRLHIAPR